MNTEDLKTCIKCKEEKPRSEFQKRRDSKDGLRNDCKGCQKQLQEQYRKENAEKISEWHKQYYKENAEMISQRDKQYYKENTEMIRQRQKQYHKENAEKINQQKRKYYKENPEKFRERNRQYKKENPEKIKQQRKQYAKNQPAAVYKIENTKTGQVYIGQSTQYKQRWGSHRHHLRYNKHDNSKLQEDYDKYGLDVFEFEVIKEFPSDTTSDVLLGEETRVIAEYAMRGESLYNLSIGFEEFRKFLIEGNNKSWHLPDKITLAIDTN